MSVSRKYKRLAILAVPVIGLLLYYGYVMSLPEESSYMTIKMTKHDINKQVFATGTLTGKTLVDVGSRVSGQVEKLHAKLGDKVTKGMLLAEIDPKTQENEVKTAKAAINITEAKINSKKAEINKLQLENKRQQNLRKLDATSKQDAESAEASYLMALAELEELKAQYEQNRISVDTANTNLEYTKITSPMDGTVYAVVVDEGQTVNANQTTPNLYRIADMEHMIVEAEISEADVVNLKEGMDCTFTVLGMPHRTFHAKLGRIAPAPSSEETTSSSSSSSSSSTSSQAIYYNSKLEIENPDGLLRIDMTADVTINVASLKGVDALPISALRSEHGTSATVYVLDENRQVKERKIGIGLRDDQYVQITEGLNELDEVVIGSDVKTAEQQAMNSKRGGPRF